MSDNRATYPNDFGATDDPATFDPLQAAPESVEYQAVQAALEGTGVVSGLTLAQGGGMTANVDRGFISIQGQQTSVPPATVTFGANPTGFARRDSVRAGLLGVYVVEGDARAIPVSKPLHRDGAGHVDEVLLATVLVPPGAPEGILDEHITHQGCPPAAFGADSGIRAVSYIPIVAADGLPSLASGLPWYSDFLWYDPTPGFEAYYACWINSLHQPMVGAWGIHDRYWKRHPLSDTVLDYADDDVLHNYTGIGMDADGFLHLSGNEHTSAVKYIRSRYSMRSGLDINGQPPGGGVEIRDITSWVDNLGMSGSNETHCSFPMFGPLPTGELLAMFPQAAPANFGGGPDDSVVSLKVYRGTGNWDEIGTVPTGRAVPCLIDSHAPVAGDTATAFMASSTIDQDGNLHLIWNWRSVTGGTEGWFYAKITGLHDGETPQAWRNPDSTDEITLPIARAGSAYSSAHYPAQVANFPPPNLINNPAPAFSTTDSNGFPHAGFIYIVGAASTVIGTGGSIQQFHLWYDNTIPDSTDATYAPPAGWHVLQVSSFVTQGGSWQSSGTPAGSATRFQPFCTPTGRIYFIGCWANEGFGGATWAYDLTGITDTDLPPKPFRLHAVPDQGDFHFDVNSQRANRLAMLMTNKQRYYQDPGDPFGAGPNNTNISANLADSNAVLGLIVEDFAQISTIARGLAQLPTIRAVATASASRIFDIGANTPTGANDILEAKLEDALNAVRQGNAFDPATLAGGSSGTIVIGPEYAGKQLFARLKVDMRLKSGGGYLVAFLVCQNLQEISAQTMVSGEAQNAVPVAQTVDAWKIDTNYSVGAKVEDQSEWWICTQAVVHSPPSHTVEPHLNLAHWDPYAALTGFFQANICALWVIDGAPDNNVKATSWIALPNFRDLNGSLGRLNLGAWTGGNANPIGEIQSASWDLGVLEA